MSENVTSVSGSGGAESDLARRVVREVDGVAALDMHTHLFASQFASHNLSGIDELLTYHYLTAEFFRNSETTPEEFAALSKAAQADRVWQALFVENTPVSESAVGLVGALTALGLDPRARNLKEMRAWFRAQDPQEHSARVMALAGVTEIVMTNDPFDAAEAAVWESGAKIDPRFKAALRLDALLNNWPGAAAYLREHGYAVNADLSGNTIGEVRRFLDRWTARMEPLYMAVSLPDDFGFPDGGARARLIEEAVLPACRDHGLPFAVMIGVRRQVNPRLGLAGDGVGRADVRALERLCAAHPDNRFLATMLSRENQHELCVAARKFSNLLPFGCWWFVNNPSMIEEITRERLEMLGTSFIPQHSDARVLEQIIYKWRHSRRIIAGAMTGQYAQLERNGFRVTDEEIRRDAARLFSGNFRQWTSHRKLVQRAA